MLRINQQKSSKGAQQYYASADYYSQGQELVGLWGGKGAKLLGLEGEVDKTSFERMCDNRDPRDGKQLTARTRSDRTVGYDFTFSVPKSVSLLYAMSGDKDILEAFRSAVDETMHDIEADMKTRLRKGGKDEDRVTANMAWAEFIHTTSRPVGGVPDPQLHAHCFVFNSTFCDKEREWKAGQFRDVKRDAPYFQAGFRVRLAGKLQDLGFGIERKRDDFEIAGIGAAMVKRFSRRTEAIEKLAAERGITDPARKGELGQETRERKASNLSLEELRKEWAERLIPGEWETLADTYRRGERFDRPLKQEGQAVDFALSHCFQREAVVPERKLLTEALKRGIGGVTVAGVQRELGRRSLLRAERGGRMMTTTDEMLGLESRLVAFAREGRGRCRPLGDPKRTCSRDWFNSGQKAAVAHVLGSRDRVMVIRGVAGSGKTTLEQEIGEALAERGHRVVALAQSVDASRGVLREEAGFKDADTVARFFKDETMQESAKGGVILVDEASQLGSRDMVRLFDLSHELNARVLLVGDVAQHRSVAAGEPLRLLQQKAGLPVAEVKEILRQSGDYKKAAKAVSEGRIGDGFAELDKLGWIREVEGTNRYRELAGEYLSAIREKKRNGKNKTALVISPTHAEASKISQAIRNSLKAQGKLKNERDLAAWLPAHLTEAQKADPTNYQTGDLLVFHQNAPGHKNGSRQVLVEDEKPPVEYASRFEVYRPSRLALAEGDRIRITANGKDKSGKHRLNNGSLYTVQGFTQRGDMVIDHNWVIDKNWGHVAAGYVVTSHASQGKTVDKVFVGQSAESMAAANTRQFTVSMSRGKEQAVIFTDDKKELLKAVQRRDEPLMATDLLQPHRRRPPLRHRLKRHLHSMRRLAAFRGAHEERQAEPQKSLQREVMNHDR